MENPSVQQRVRNAEAAIYEKYGLPQVPKTSWKDLCMIELKSLGIECKQKTYRYEKEKVIPKKVDLV